MTEPRRISDLEYLQPFFRIKVINWLEECKKQGVELRVIESLRTFERQRWLYEQGRSREGNIVTYALPGQGLHGYGLAVDAYPVVNGRVVVEFDNDLQLMSKQRLASRIGQKFSLEWGGNWERSKDYPHFEQWEVSWQTLRKFYPMGWLPGRSQQLLWIRPKKEAI